jgi:tetratricopeptide (TPR) repeat protein
MTETEKALDELYDRAEQLRQANRPKDMATVCDEILKLDPASVPALQFLSTWSLGEGRFADAVKYFRPYCEAVPNQEAMMLPFAVALEETGQLEEAKRVLQRALKLNESNFFTHTYLGSVLEKLNRPEQAAWAYSFGVDLNPALKVLPARGKHPKLALDRVTRSNQFLKGVGRTLHLDAVAKAKAKFPNVDFSRIEKAVWRKLHDERIGLVNPKQQPMVFYIPGLDRAAWFEREEFAWTADLEKEFVPIRNEVLECLRVDVDTKPYLQQGSYDGKSWGDMVGNRDWSAMHFYDGMKRKDPVCQRFPVTAKALETLPVFRVGGSPVEALYSILKPKTKIPPHFGNSNARITVHLPLVVPKGCVLKVDDEEREMVAGKAMFFDDTFRHLAWNDSDEVRIVLIVEAWHPDLREEERAAVEATYLAYEAWMKARDHDALLND